MIHQWRYAPWSSSFRSVGGFEMLSGVMWTWMRMRQVLFHQENLDVRAMACWTKSALETNGGAVGPQR